jgi:NADPH-dependent curcumin reductase CurA
MTTSRQIHLAARPDGWPKPSDFRTVEVDVPEPADGQVVVRNVLMSVDPYMRGRMNDAESYVAPFALDAPLDGGALGEVVASRSDQVPVGTTVLHGLGWREHAVLDARRVRPVDTDAAPAAAYLGVLGMTGLTAYAGLTAIARLQPGETVFVSGAAGAVGSVAGQVAKLLGAGRVIGSAGSPEKVAHLRELGFDAAFDYKQAPVRQSLEEAAPDGVDVYFDNVGGDHLEAAIARLNRGGRVAMCGAISQYNASGRPTGPGNLFQLIAKRASITGFLVGDHDDLAPEYMQRAAGWLREGRLQHRETIVDGIDHAVDAFLGVLRGDNTGKMLVRLG